MADIKLNQVHTSQCAKSVRSFKPLQFSYNLDLDEFLSVACPKFNCDFKVIVKKDVQVDEYQKPIKHETASKLEKINLHAFNNKFVVSPCLETETEETASRSTIRDEVDTITITALYDSANRLAEIVLHKTRVPRNLIQLLGLILPHHPQLAKLVIKKCRISAHIIYEMSKFLSLTTITEICLDDSPIPESNYALLLQNQSKLSSLSLSRCTINDEVCKQIAVTLKFLEPAEATLLTLNLSSNHITDAGAKHLGEALRTNRHLRYLNLAGNRIGDEGANHIFHALIDFPLTYDETKEKLKRRLAYLRARQAAYLECLMSCDSRSLDDFSMINKKSPKKSTAAKNKVKKLPNETVNTSMHVKAEMIINKPFPLFKDPFESSFIRFVDGDSHCVGNMVLCYLNLCYNDLSYSSLKKLQAVLLYQSVSKNTNQTGLMRVLIEGNQLPSTCSEIGRISELLHKNVVNFIPKFLVNKQRTLAYSKAV